MNRFLSVPVWIAVALISMSATAIAEEAPPLPVTGPADESTQPQAEGILNAASLHPIPPGAGISVKPWDNAAENLELGRYIEDQLRARGFLVAEAAPMTLKFSTSDSLGQLGTGRQRQMIELDAKAGTASDNDAQVKLNLFSSDKGGVFNEGRQQTKVLSEQSLEMTIDGADGQRLWQGEGTAKLTSQDRRQLSRMLVGPMLDSVGKTARSQPFGIK